MVSSFESKFPFENPPRRFFVIQKIYIFSFSRYIPPRLWGFSGHAQTILHSIIGRVRCPWPIGERVYLNLQDGTTLTYDLYQALDTTYEGNLIKAVIRFCLIIIKVRLIFCFQTI